CGGWGLRGEGEGVRIRGAYDQRQRPQGWVFELVLLEEGVKRARLTMVAELDARNVVRDRPLAGRDRLDLIRGHKEKCRVLVDESADEPGASDAIDACLLTSHPFHSVVSFRSSAPWTVPAPKT